MKRNHVVIQTAANMSRCSTVTSLGLSYGRYLVRAVENSCARLIDAQPEHEIACRRGQPVGFMTCRRGVLNVDVDGAVGIRHKAGAITYTVSVDRIRHKAISRIAHGQRPECIVGRKAARREMHHVVVLPVERMARTIYVCPPIHRLFRYVHGPGKYWLCAARSSMPLPPTPNPN